MWRRKWKLFWKYVFSENHFAQSQHSLRERPTRDNDCFNSKRIYRKFLRNFRLEEKTVFSRVTITKMPRVLIRTLSRCAEADFQISCRCVGATQPLLVQHSRRVKSQISGDCMCAAPPLVPQFSPPNRLLANNNSFFVSVESVSSWYCVECIDKKIFQLFQTVAIFSSESNSNKLLNVSQPHHCILIKR